MHAIFLNPPELRPDLSRMHPLSLFYRKGVWEIKTLQFKVRTILLIKK